MPAHEDSLLYWCLNSNAIAILIHAKICCFNVCHMAEIKTQSVPIQYTLKPSQTKICGAGLLSLDSDVENRKTFHLLKEKHHHFLRYKAPSTAVLPRRSPAGKPEMSGDHKWDVLPSGKWMQMSLFRLVTGWKLWSNPEGFLEFASKWQQFSKQSAASSATDLKLPSVLSCLRFHVFVNWAHGHAQETWWVSRVLCCKILAWSTKKLAKNWVTAMALAYWWWTKSCLHRDMLDMPWIAVF